MEFTEKPPQPNFYAGRYRLLHLPSAGTEIFVRIIVCKERRDLLGSFIAHLVDTDEVFGFPFWEKWFDIGSEVNQGGRIKMG